MIETPHHEYLVLTKRPNRAKLFEFPPNVSLGVSVENRATTFRIETLRKCAVSKRFLSMEPLLESVAPIDLTDIDWVIVGGESGVGYRPMDHLWARELLHNCRGFGVPFFFKQSAHRFPGRGTKMATSTGKIKSYLEVPDYLKHILFEHETKPEPKPETKQLNLFNKEI